MHSYIIVETLGENNGRDKKREPHTKPTLEKKSSIVSSVFALYEREGNNVVHDYHN
jgi:hypothetical protein